MKIHILPNWCKKLGLTLFLIASLINGGFNFISNSIYKYGIQGINTADIGIQTNNGGIIGLLNAFTGGGLLYFIDFLAIIAMLIYMTSKEKTEDDYINKLRLESFQLTTIIGLVVVIILYATSKALVLTLDYFIFPFLWSYLLLFFLKRRVFI